MNMGTPTPKKPMNKAEAIKEYDRKMAEALERHIRSALKTVDITVDGPLTDNQFRRVDKLLAERGKKLMVAIITNKPKKHLEKEMKIGEHLQKFIYCVIAPREWSKQEFYDNLVKAIGDSRPIDKDAIWEISDFSELDQEEPKSGGDA